MKNAIQRLEAFDEKSQVNVIVETPKGSRVKYTYSSDLGLFRLKRTLPVGMAFPFNFGFIPSTLGEDGDALDMLIINDEPAVCGCLIKARLLAVIKARQAENGKWIENDRIIGMAIDEETPAEYYEPELNRAHILQIEFFFITYNKLSGKKFKICGVEGPHHAEKIIRQGMKKFRQQQK